MVSYELRRNKVHLNATTCYAIQLLAELATQKRQMSRTELSERTGVTPFCQNILLRPQARGPGGIVARNRRRLLPGKRLWDHAVGRGAEAGGARYAFGLREEASGGVLKGMYWEFSAIQRDIEKRLDEITIGRLSEIAGACKEPADEDAATDQKAMARTPPRGKTVLLRS